MAAMKTKIEHRSTRPTSGTSRDHRSAQIGSAEVSHLPARAINRGDHRKIAEVAPLPGSTPPLVDHRPAAASRASIDHFRVAKEDKTKGVVHRAAHFQKAVEVVSPVTVEALAETPNEASFVDPIGQEELPLGSLEPERDDEDGEEDHGTDPPPSGEGEDHA